MTYDFTSLATIFQSYQEDERLIMKGCVQWAQVDNERLCAMGIYAVEKISLRAGLDPRWRNGSILIFCLNSSSTFKSNNIMCDRVYP